MRLKGEALQTERTSTTSTEYQKRLRVSGYHKSGQRISGTMWLRLNLDPDNWDIPNGEVIIIDVRIQNKEEKKTAGAFLRATAARR